MEMVIMEDAEYDSALRRGMAMLPTDGETECIVVAVHRIYMYDHVRFHSTFPLFLFSFSRFEESGAPNVVVPCHWLCFDAVQVSWWGDLLCSWRLFFLFLWRLVFCVGGGREREKKERRRVSRGGSRARGAIKVLLRRPPSLLYMHADDSAEGDKGMPSSVICIQSTTCKKK